MSLSASALVDTGANGYLFISRRLAQRLRRKLGAVTTSDFSPHPVGGFDGAISQRIDTALQATLRVQRRSFNNSTFLVLDMDHEMILGRKWLEALDVFPDVRRQRLLFPEEIPVDPPLPSDISMDAVDCTRPNPKHQEDVDRRERKMEEEDRQRRQRDVAAAAVRLRIQQLEDQAVAAKTAAKEEAARQQPPMTILPRPARETHVGKGLSEKDWKKMEADLLDLPPTPPPTPNGSPVSRRARRTEEGEAASGMAGLKYDAQGPYFLRKGFGWHKERVDIAVIQATSFEMLAKRDQLEICSINLYEVEQRLDELRQPLQDEPELLQQALEQVPVCYHNHLDIFSKKASDVLSPHHPGRDHVIALEKDKTTDDLRYSPLYKMSLAELEACRTYIRDNLEKGFIVPSDAPWAAPILMARKGDGGLRLCVDFRRLNAITKKDRYPLPLIDETLARISGAKIFSKIDIRQAFHKLRLREEDEDLTTFRTRYGSYKYKVLPFGLTGGPATFQRYINETLIHGLDEYCSAYLDDVLIFSNSLEEHQVHVTEVLQRLKEADLQANLQKCKFHVEKTKYLGFIVSTEGIAVDPEKVLAVRDWTVPTTLKGVQSFLGFSNFYRRFIEQYGRIARPLHQLTRKGASFVWTNACQEAFNTLQKKLTDAPLLHHFRHDLETKVETDASDGVVAGVLSQMSGGLWHPVSYFSETMAPAELNYFIHDKELLAVVRALQYWRPELVGAREPFTIYTDY